MLDWRGYAGQWVILGRLGSSYETSGFDLRHCYVLGTIAAGQDLPAAVKAIIEDVDDDLPEADEVLWVLEVNAQGTAYQRFPLVVSDDHERLRYGDELLTAVIDTGITAKALVVRGLRLEDPRC